jgi:hypothetical protein
MEIDPVVGVRLYNASTSSADPTLGQEWKKLWKMEIPGKVKNFLWRLAHNSLPTRMNIKRKGVELDTLCPVCNRLDEDGVLEAIRFLDASSSSMCGEKWT